MGAETGAAEICCAACAVVAAPAAGDIAAPGTRCAEAAAVPSAAGVTARSCVAAATRCAATLSLLALAGTSAGTEPRCGRLEVCAGTGLDGSGNAAGAAAGLANCTTGLEPRTSPPVAAAAEFFATTAACGRGGRAFLSVRVVAAFPDAFVLAGASISCGEETLGSVVAGCAAIAVFRDEEADGSTHVIVCAASSDSIAAPPAEGLAVGRASSTAEALAERFSATQTTPAADDAAASFNLAAGFVLSPAKEVVWRASLPSTVSSAAPACIALVETGAQARAGFWPGFSTACNPGCETVGRVASGTSTIFSETAAFAAPLAPFSESLPSASPARRAPVAGPALVHCAITQGRNAPASVPGGTASDFLLMAPPASAPTAIPICATPTCTPVSSVGKRCMRRAAGCRGG